MSIPHYLYEQTRSFSEITPPIETRKQALPVSQFSWENFERLILHIAEELYAGK